MSSRADELRRRRETLLAQVSADRGLMSAQHAQIAAGLTRADGWLAVARRVTPAAAIGAIALGIIVGPGRIVRMLQTAAVPALLIRQLLMKWTGGEGRDLSDWLSLFRRRE